MASPSTPSDTAIAAPPADLCLAFVNTRYWRGTEEPTEELRSFDHLLAWCERNGGPPVVAAAMRERASADAKRADGWFGEAIALREALARALRAVAEGQAPRPVDLDALNLAIAAAPSRARVIQGTGGYAWSVTELRAGVAALLAPVLWSAGDLLTGRRLDRMRRCGNDRCLWLFLDDSKSGNRKWCMMSACGNRAKAHRHRARLRAEAAG